MVTGSPLRKRGAEGDLIGCPPSIPLLLRGRLVADVFAELQSFELLN